MPDQISEAKEQVAAIKAALEAQLKAADQQRAEQPVKHRALPAPLAQHAPLPQSPTPTIPATWPPKPFGSYFSGQRL